jgi:hypothetical protein
MHFDACEVEKLLDRNPSQIISSRIVSALSVYGQLHRFALLVNCGRRSGAFLWTVDVNDQISFIPTTKKKLVRTSASSVCHTYYESLPQVVSLYLVPQVLHLPFSPA